MTVPAVVIQLSKILKSRDTDEAILAAATEAVEAVNALDGIAALIGSSDTQSMLKQAAEMVAKAKQLEPLIAALAAANDQIGKQADEQAVAEVDAVAASMKWDESTTNRVKPLLLAQRRACIVAGDPKRTDDPKAMATHIDEAKLAKFRVDWPLPEVPAGTTPALLTRATFAGPGGQQLGGAATGAPVTAPIAGNGGTGAGGGSHVDEIRKFSGRNDVERTIACLKTKEKDSFTRLSFKAQCFVAGQYLKTGVYDPSAQVA